MLACCTHAESKGKIVPLTDKVRAYVLRKADELNGGGMRVIAVAQKTNPAPEGQFSTADEKDMVLIGFLAFLDPPKETTRDAIHALREYGVGVKILTGDNEKVTCAICRQVGLNAERVLLGADIDAMDDETLAPGGGGNYRLREALARPESARRHRPAPEGAFRGLYG